MPRREARPRIDPELTRQLEAAKDGDEPVEVVLFLKSGRRAVPSEVTAEARGLVERVEADVGEAPNGVNVMRNIGTMVVSASARFVEVLVEQPEVVSAVANRQPNDAGGLLGRPSKPVAEPNRDPKQDPD